MSVSIVFHEQGMPPEHDSGGRELRRTTTADADLAA